ncbi:MAG: lipopolysaccharide assembly protein LapA domain-containing protein [Cognaticolwellia sp.]
MRLYITVILFLMLLAIAFIFGSQNDQTFTLNYLIAKTNISVAEAVGIFTSLGFILGLLFALIWKLLSMMKLTKKSPQNTAKKS